MSIRDKPPGSITTWAEVEVYRTLYDDITAGGVVLDINHRHALAELSCLTVEMSLLRAHVNEHGASMTVNGDKRNTVTKRNPSVDALLKCRVQYLQLLKEFKMTPASGKKQGLELGEKTGDDGWSDV